MNRFLTAVCALLLAASLPLGALAQTTVIGSIRFGGVVRDYRLYVPAAYQPGGAAVPLLFNLHGYGSNSLEQESYGDFRPIADTANFLVLHPNGTVSSGSRYWNTFAPPGTGTPDDVAFLSALLDSIRLTYAVDPTRVYSTGMSNGGFMSYELACRLNGRIAAIASVTGSIAISHLAGWCAPQHLTPVMEIHGTADNTVPYGGNPLFLPIPDVLAYWVQTNQTGPPVVTPVPDVNTGDGCTAERTAWAHPTLGETVVHYRVIGGGHTWPGAIFPIGVTNQDFNASTEIWRFLRRFRLNQLPALTMGAPAPDAAYAAMLSVSPNPAGSTGELRVQFGSQALLPEQVTVYDALGRLVAGGRAVVPGGGVVLDARAWPVGVYRVRVLVDGRAYWRTVVR